MKLKIAAMLIVSVLMSANTSYGGDLLDRMLGRAGCSSCAAPAAKSCGCGGGGLLDKLLSGCGCKNKCNGAGLLKVDSNAGCGCQAAAPSCGCEAAPAVEASPCGCEAPVQSCGCEAAPVVGASPFVEASPCGCDAAPAVEASPCGCEAASVVEASPCGCGAAPAVEASPCGCSASPAVAASPCGSAAPAMEPRGLLVLLRNKTGGCGCNSAPAAASSCGCEAAPTFAASPCGCEAAPTFAASPCGCEAAPAVAASPCGVDAAPAAGGCGSGGGFLSRLKGMGCGCGSAAPAVEASACGCDAAPAVQASTCGFTAPAVATTPCGCSAAPAVSTCGCDAPSPGCKSGGGGTRPAKLSLLDRLKGNRIPRDRNGKVLGVCNDGCNPPCPVAPQADCGCGSYVEAPYVVDAAPYGSCSTCGGGEVIYSDAMPANACANGMCGSTPTYGEAVALPAAAAVLDGSESQVDPVVPTDTEGSLQAVEEIEETDRRDITQPSVSDDEDDPIVDPGAFIPRPTNTLGS